MSTTPNAYGNALGTSMPFVQWSAVGTPFGQLVKPGGRVAAFVRSTGAQDLDDLFVRDNLVASVNEAAKRCRSGLNDIIYALPGHVESITAADSWSNVVPGTQIISAGVPGATNNPTITWANTAATLALNDANVTILGLTLVWNGVDAVATPMPVTAAGNIVAGCNIVLEATAAGALKGVEVSSASANGFRFLSNTMLSANLTKLMTSSPVLVSAAADDIVIADNYISNGNPGTNVLGLIAVTAAATNVRILRNTLIQLNTAGTALFTVTVGAVAATGVIAYNNSLIATDVTATTSGVTVNAAAAATMGVFENRTKDATATNGVLSPVVAA
jgi:hypothetical protein